MQNKLYYAKYIKYKNKYLNLKYQLGGFSGISTRKVVSDTTPKESQKVVGTTTPKVSQNFDSYTKFVDITIPPESKTLELDKLTLRHFFLNLVAFKILESNLSILMPFLAQKRDFDLHFYRYTDEDAKVYILCSLLSYYRFLFTLYEHIEFEEVKINKDASITSVVSDRIYHVIPKPQSVPSKEITLLPMVIHGLDKFVEALKLNLFIIIRNNNLALLTAICMYNLFIGTIHVYVIYQKTLQTNLFLLSLFTQYELKQKGITIPQNIEIHECRLYKQGDIIESKLYRDMVDMLFMKYQKLKDEGYFEIALFRGDSEINNRLLNELDPILLAECRKCISIRDIAFNTTLCLLLPDKIEAKDHKDILEMEKDFLRNKFELINTNEKLMSSRLKYIDKIQLREYSLEELREEVEKFKKELLGLEPCHRELLVQKLIEKGFTGRNMDEILQNSVLCYLEDEDKNKRLVYENTKQIDPNDNFAKETPYTPEMKEILERKGLGEDIESELHKYRQTVLILWNNNEIEKNYNKNQRYFFSTSFYEPIIDPNYEPVFDPLSWSIKLNKLCFQCLILRDKIIFPFRIINIEYLNSPLTFSFNKNKLKFCGYFYTRFINNYNGVNNFNIECKDKFYFIYQFTDHDGNLTGKEYKLYYYTGNSIWFEMSMLPYFKIILCEINWIYYTFILKYRTIPHFYKYINQSGKIEIVVSKFSLDQLRCIYEENGYDVLELNDLEEIFYNHNYYKIKDITEKIFVDSPLFQSQEEEIEFIHNVSLKSKNKNRV